MFRMEYITTGNDPKPVGTIKVNKPIWSLGNVKDVDGTMWNVRGIIGKRVFAIPVKCLHPYFNDTSGTHHGFVSQKWHLYNTEIVEQ
jgi:hypothetical protein